MNEHVVEFFLSKDDEPFEIQLEPECFIFEVSPTNSVKFVALSDDPDFRWALQIDFKNVILQLFPSGKSGFDIEVFENGKLTIKLD